MPLLQVSKDHGHALVISCCLFVLAVESAGSAPSSLTPVVLWCTYGSVLWLLFAHAVVASLAVRGAWRARRRRNLGGGF